MTSTCTRDQQRIAQSRRLRKAPRPARVSFELHAARPSVRLQRLYWTDPNMHRAPGIVGSKRVRMEAWRSAVLLCVARLSNGARKAGWDSLRSCRQGSAALRRTLEGSLRLAASGGPPWLAALPLPCRQRDGPNSHYRFSDNPQSWLWSVPRPPSRGPPSWPLTSKTFSWKGALRKGVGLILTLRRQRRWAGPPACRAGRSDPSPGRIGRSGSGF